MPELQALHALQAEAASLFAATILLVVFFLVARVGGARQPVALAFAFFPMVAVIAAAGIVGV